MKSDLDELLRCAHDGQTEAFGGIWRLLSPRVAGYLRGRGVVEVDDVTSEVFLAAFRALSGFRGDGVAFRSWLFTIAHHKAVDAVRVPHHQPLDEEDIRRQAPSAEDEALTRSTSVDVMSALTTLTPAQREVILLRVIADLTVDDVARMTGNTPGGVRQLQKRAVATLRSTWGHPVRRIPRPRVPKRQQSTIAKTP